MGPKVHIWASQAPRKQQSLSGAMNRGTWEVPQPQRAAQARCCLSGFTRQSENPISSTALTPAVFQHCLYSWDRTLPFWSECHDYLKSHSAHCGFASGAQQWHSFCREHCHCQAAQLGDTKCVFKGQHPKEGFEQRSLLSPVTSAATNGERH